MFAVVDSGLPDGYCKREKGKVRIQANFHVSLVEQAL